MAIELGQRVRDKVTGFEGIATGRTVYLAGCVRVVVQPLTLKDGLPQEAQWFDETLLEAVAEEHKASAKRTGGPRPEERTAR